MLLDSLDASRGDARCLLGGSFVRVRYAGIEQSNLDILKGIQQKNVSMNI